MANASDSGNRVHPMPFGAQLQPDGRVRFRIYAPAVQSLELIVVGLSHTLPMVPMGEGWFEVLTHEASPGSRYRFRLPEGREVPDPASRFQPVDVHGPSEVIDPAAYQWRDGDWQGRPWEQAILYELHVGAFTQTGTFRAAIDQLDHLAALGITAIELMSIADFAGNRNWGYDAVLLYAPDSAYGRPQDMKAFIDAAHARGIMVILDVVYNHFGPEENRLPEYFPQIRSPRHRTPWGHALNFDGPGSGPVREFILHNALYWIEEFHVDGLRLDASHAMIDESPTHILDELRNRVLAATPGRAVHLILENEQNIAQRLTRDPAGRLQGYAAQWNHDITHLLAAVLGKPCEQRTQDDGGETEKLGKALAEGFVIAAQQKGRTELDRHVPPTAFVAFIQTHDLVGNRVFGDRIASLVPPQTIRAIASIYLLLPQIPMIFMGEEWGTTHPFPFFCDYHGDLAEAVRKGRREQLSRQDPAPSKEELQRAPDPQAEATFRSAQLDWRELDDPAHAEWLRWYQRVLQVRTREIVPLLTCLAETCGEYEIVGPGALKITWTLAKGASLHLAANLCSQPTSGLGPATGKIIWLEGSEQPGELAPWSVRWSVQKCAE